VFDPKTAGISEFNGNGINGGVVRPSGDRYQLVAGERPWRAAKLASPESAPVVIQGIPDERLLKLHL
jgi:ParB-like chromosome segregation protein Spo0J